MSQSIPLAPCRACQAQVSTQALSCPHCGQPFPAFAGFDKARAEALQGNLINAIKSVREATGMGLKEAKDMVESWVHGHPKP